MGVILATSRSFSDGDLDLVGRARAAAVSYTHLTLPTKA